MPNCNFLIFAFKYPNDHYNQDIKKEDFDLFDAITRRIEIRFIGFDSRFVKIFEESSKVTNDLLR